VRRAAALILVGAAPLAACGGDEGYGPYDAAAKDAARSYVRHVVHGQIAQAAPIASETELVKLTHLSELGWFVDDRDRRVAPARVRRDCGEGLPLGPYPGGDCLVVEYRARSTDVRPVSAKLALRGHFYLWLSRVDGRWRVDESWYLTQEAELRQ
jgi:hypothetical protein